ncbi:MAG: hypothetical protein HOO96_17115 [Polyangiaceae bacterium]|nr:hypothetical protein [Polyangiaceae bacterium]
MRELQNEVRSGGNDEASGERAIHRPQSSWDDLLDDTPTRVGPAGFAHAAFAATEAPPVVIRPSQPNAGETLRLPPDENPLAVSFSVPEAAWPQKEQARTLRLGAIRVAEAPATPSPFPPPPVPSSTVEAHRAPRRSGVTFVIGLLVLCAMALLVAGWRFGAVAFLR